MMVCIDLNLGYAKVFDDGMEEQWTDIPIVF